MCQAMYTSALVTASETSVQTESGHPLLGTYVRSAPSPSRCSRRLIRHRLVGPVSWPVRPIKIKSDNLFTLRYAKRNNVINQTQ